MSVAVVTRRVSIMIAAALLGASACRKDAALPRGGRLSVRLTSRDTAVPAPATRDTTQPRASARGTASPPRPDSGRHDSAAGRSPRPASALLAFTASATGEWCDSLRMLQVRAILGDTGMAIAFYPGARIEPGEYPLKPPDRADTARPRAAAIAARWLSATAVQGFQGESGAVTLTRAADGTLGGRFHGTGHGVPIALRLSIAGSFEGVRPAPAPASCGGTPKADTARGTERDGEADDSGSGVD
jgi:hypothetical protein